MVENLNKITPALAQSILDTVAQSIGHVENYGWEMFANRGAFRDGRAKLPEGVDVSLLNEAGLWKGEKLDVDRLEAIAHPVISDLMLQICTYKGADGKPVVTAMREYGDTTHAEGLLHDPEVGAKVRLEANSIPHRVMCSTYVPNSLGTPPKDGKASTPLSMLGIGTDAAARVEVLQHGGLSAQEALEKLVGKRKLPKFENTMPIGTGVILIGEESISKYKEAGGVLFEKDALKGSVFQNLRLTQGSPRVLPCLSTETFDDKLTEKLDRLGVKHQITDGKLYITEADGIASVALSGGTFAGARDFCAKLDLNAGWIKG